MNWGLAERKGVEIGFQTDDVVKIKVGSMHKIGG